MWVETRFSCSFPGTCCTNPLEGTIRTWDVCEALQLQPPVWGQTCGARKPHDYVLVISKKTQHQSSFGNFPTNSQNSHPNYGHCPQIDNHQIMRLTTLLSTGSRPRWWYIGRVTPKLAYFRFVNYCNQHQSNQKYHNSKKISCKWYSHIFVGYIRLVWTIGSPKSWSLINHLPMVSGYFGAYIFRHLRISHCWFYIPGSNSIPHMVVCQLIVSIKQQFWDTASPPPTIHG